MLHSIIIPCYNSDQTIRHVVELTMEWMDKLGKEYEFILVDDYSPNNPKTINELKKLAEEYRQVKVLELAYNSGQHNAIMAGLNYASGDICIAMDDDGQTHPSQLPILLDKLEEGYDIVYGYYPEKKHSMFRNLGSYFNYLTVRYLIGRPKGMKTSSFWVIRKFVRDEIIKYRAPYTQLQGLFLRTTKNIGTVPIQHFEREVGVSNYTLKKLIHLWSNMIGFSVVPLKLATNLGYFFSFVGILGVFWIIISKILRPHMLLGWPSMMVVMCFFSGIILLFMGLIGEYIGRMFLSMQNTPQFVVRQVYGEDKEEREEAKDEKDSSLDRRDRT